MKLAVRKLRAQAYDSFKALADQPTLTTEQHKDYEAHKRAVTDLDGQIERTQAVQDLARATATPVGGQPAPGSSPGAGRERRVYAALETSAYLNDEAAKRLAELKGFAPGSARSIVFGGMINMLAAGGGTIWGARQAALETYGEDHPVTRALITSVGASGGFIIPPDYMAEIIELLRPMAQVRSAGPRVIPMPRGTLTLPGQASPATASYGGEVQQIAASQQTLRQIVASYKKLTALVPVSNDMMRFADPAVDAFVRDDLVKVIALREDLAFLLGDGTSDTPRGFLSFANGWVGQNSGTTGAWSTTGNSTLAVNGADPANTTGGNFITANETYTLATVASELGGAVNRLDQANVPEDRRVWFWNPRIKNYLYNVQNSLGVYVYRDEMEKGKLLSYPFRNTTQIGANYYDANGAHTDCSFIFLAEMSEAMILDSMSLELAVSREGSYVDSTGATQSAFQNDQTLIRAIAEHDFQVRHDQAVAVIQNVRYAPAIS